MANMTARKPKLTPAKQLKMEIDELKGLTLAEARSWFVDGFAPDFDAEASIQNSIDGLLWEYGRKHGITFDDAAAAYHSA